MSPMVRRVGVGVVLLWLLVPLVPTLAWAGAERWSFPDVVPSQWGWRGVRDAVAAGLPLALLRSLGLALAVAVVATPVGVLLGRALGWRITRRPRLVVASLLLPLVLPPFAVAMGLDVVLLRLGVPAPVSVVLLLATVATPYVAFASATAFGRLDRDLEHQARALGAGPWRTLVGVVLPAVRRSVVVGALLAFLVGWSDYVVTVLIGGGQLITAPVLLGSAAAGSGNESQVAVMAVAIALPPILLVTVLAGVRSRHRSAP